MDKKSRGGCLTAYLILVIIGTVLSNVFSLVAPTIYESAGLPQEVINQTKIDPIVTYTSILLGIISIIGCVFIFKWKKLGVYLYVGSMMLGMLVSFFTAPSTMTIVGALVGTLIGLAIFYFLIRNVYKHLT